MLFRSKTAIQTELAMTLNSNSKIQNILKSILQKWEIFQSQFYLHFSVFSCKIQTISAIITVLIMKWKQCSAWQQRILAVRIETTSKCHPNIVTCRTAIVKQIAVKNDFFFSKMVGKKKNVNCETIWILAAKVWRQLKM